MPVSPVQPIPQPIPSEYLVEPDAATIAAAYEECTRLARAHYENFPVGQLVPREMQPHVHAIYAFARHADDLADEGYAGSAKAQGAQDIMTPEQRMEALQLWDQQLQSPCGVPGLHPIFIALHKTIRTLDLPLHLFTDLLSAFKQDVVKARYENFDEVLNYCRRSANPIGRLVLLLHGVHDELLHQRSDDICTGLQLANFWQDVGVDLEKNRIYLPADDLKTFGVTVESLFARHADQKYRDLIKAQVDRTQKLFDRGAPLTKKLKGKLRLEIRLTWLGGTTILRKIERLKYDTLNHRPKLGKADMALLFLRALVS
jgi:squalene synthase HpnC